MKVLIRADASPAIGSGHVMRCLCLAGALRDRGASVCLVSRAMPEHLAQMVLAQGHQLIPLPGEAPTDETQDARQTLAACGPSDWIVVDHYALGTVWESMLRESGRLMVIDDLARSHQSDLLLDQNFHTEPDRRYAGRVTPGCTQLLGPRYALLRPEFARARQDIAPREGEVRRLLVCLGGMDADNLTEKVLQAIALLDRPDLALDVVIGAVHPARERVKAMCDARPGALCHIQSSDMAALLAGTDLAIGAGGSATWERCALGVPTLALCLADNQRYLLLQGSQRGFLYVPDIAAGNTPALALHLRALLSNSGLRHHLSRTGLELVDAKGAQRVAAALFATGIAMRRATRDDAGALFAWRNDPAVRAASRDPAEIQRDSHERWLDSVLAAPSRHLLIGECEGAPVGVVRFDAADTVAEVSIYLVPARTGRGEGAALLRAAEAWLSRERPEVRALQAQVHAGNTPSQRLFSDCGYDLQSTRYSKRICP